MRIAYGKLGRSIPLTLEDASNVGGDIEVVRLFDILRQNHEVHLVTRNRGSKHANVVNHWEENGKSLFGKAVKASRGMQRFPDDPHWLEYSRIVREGALQLPAFDAWFIWLGQHGSTLSYLPRVQKAKLNDPRLQGKTRPLISDVNYGYPIIEILNQLDVQPNWLCPDPRNRIKFRDLNNPSQQPILAQYNTQKANTFYSPEHGIRKGSTQYQYAGIELLAVPPPENKGQYFSWTSHNERDPFGILVNEGYHNLGPKHNRVEFVKRWLWGLEPYEIFGHWSAPSQVALKREIEPVPLSRVHDTLMRWRSTITFPATGTGWATAKPWECFKAGTICFRHPKYDTQEHIYGKHMPEELRSFLSPLSTTRMQERIKELENYERWQHFARMQYQYLWESYDRLQYGAKAIHGILDTCIPKSKTLLEVFSADHS